MGRDRDGEDLVDELEQRIRDAGMAGYVVIATQKRIHFRHIFDPPWSAFAFDRNTGYLRQKIRSRDFKDRGQADRTLNDSINILAGMRDVLTATVQALNRLLVSIAEQRDVSQHGTDPAGYQPPPRRRTDD